MGSCRTRRARARHRLRSPIRNIAPGNSKSVCFFQSMRCDVTASNTDRPLSLSHSLVEHTCHRQWLDSSSQHGPRFASNHSAWYCILIYILNIIYYRNIGEQIFRKSSSRLTVWLDARFFPPSFRRSFRVCSRLLQCNRPVSRSNNRRWTCNFIGLIPEISAFHGMDILIHAWLGAIFIYLPFYGFFRFDFDTRYAAPRQMKMATNKRSAAALLSNANDYFEFLAFN